MEMSHQGGAEGESLLRPDHRSAVVMPQGPRNAGWEPEEKAPFLRNEPVKLTPAWEGSNLPNDTLNLKGIAMDLRPPKDKWHLIYLTLVLHGLGALTAWNMFITAKPYFVEYKLHNTTYADSYLVYVGYASQLPNFLFSWVNVFVPLGGDLATRIVWSLIIEVGIFVLTIALAMVDSAAWPAAFFWVTMVSVFVLNACNAVFQNSVFGVAGRLPPQYTGAVVLGTNVCGTVVVLLNWVSSTFASSLRTSAIYYFIGGMFVLLVCFDTYFALPLNRFYRYHDTLEQRTLRVNPALAATAPPPPRRTPYGRVLRQCWVQLLNVWLVFFVSLAVFPAVHSDIFSMDDPTLKKPEDGFLGKDFSLITCYLTFNLTAMIGNITASFVHFPSRRWLAVFTIARIVFIPLFLLCNYHPPKLTRTLGVVIGHDGLYWLLAILLGWSSGHCSSLAMMYVSGKVAPEHASKAGMLGGAMLITGILSGIAFSGISPWLVTLDIWKSA